MKRAAALAALAAGLWTGLRAQPRVGFYQWVGVRPADDGTDLLTAARERTAGLGLGLLRLYLGPRFDYVRPYLSPRRFEGEIDGPRTPAAILRLPRYAAVLDDPRLDTVVFTVYTARDYGGGWDDLNLLRPWGEAEREAEEQQIEELGDLLFRRWGESEKTVVIANNEADEKLMEILNYTGSAELAVENLAAWANARQRSVERVRARRRGARLRLLHAFEISAVRLRIAEAGGRYRKSARGEGWNALADVLPRIRCDLVSYSAYESANAPYDSQAVETPPEETAVRLRRDLDAVRDAAVGSISDYGRGIFGARFVMIGELGFARDRFEPVSSGGVLPRMESAFRAARAWGCPFLVVWQVFDAPRQGSEAWGFGAFDAAGRRPALRPDGLGCDSVAACVERWSETSVSGAGR